MGETGGTQEYERWVERDVSWGDVLRKMISGGGKEEVGEENDRLVEGEKKCKGWFEGNDKWLGVG